MCRLRQSFRHFIPVILAALLCIGISPKGYMAEFGSDGFSIEICSGMADTELTIDRSDPNFELLALVNGIEIPDEADHPKADDADKTPSCAFAGIGFALPTSTGWVITDSLPATSIAPAALHAQLKSRHSARTPPATGPPVSVYGRVPRA